jgi:hypothetical protein
MASTIPNSDISSFLLENIRLTAYNGFVLTSEDRWASMDYISTTQAADRWGISERRVATILRGWAYQRAFRFSRVWAIPKDAPKPTDSQENKN